MAQPVSFIVDVAVTGAWRGIDALIQMAKGDRSRFTKGVVEGLAETHPGCTFVICFVQHECTGYSNSQLVIGPELDATHLCGFKPDDKGRFVLKGDGEYLNWAISGFFSRDDNICVINP